MVSTLHLSSFALACFLCATSVPAQESVADSVHTSPQYANEVFYSMEHGMVQTIAHNGWDIAFQIQGYSSAIRINDGSGVQLYHVPNSTEETWAQPLDTTGIAETWQQWHNSTLTWDIGAFTMDRDYNTGDFGWGEYNMGTHTVNGTAVFVLKISDGSWKKIFIDGLANKTYSFRYADLDGGNEVMATLQKDDFKGKNFGYYSLVHNNVVDREPLASAWDITFGKYTAMVGPDNNIPYGVMGVRSNAGVRVAVRTGDDAQNTSVPDSDAFSSAITAIGHTWKIFSLADGWLVPDTAAYFVQTATDDIYRLAFTHFGGSSNGTIVFARTKMATTDIRENERNTGSFAVYPSVAASGEPIRVVYNYNAPVRNAALTVCDVTGRTAFQRTLAPTSAAQLSEFALPPLPSGMYIVVLHINGTRTHQKLMIR